MEILAKGNLSPDEILKIAKANGVQLTKDDIAAIMKGKPKTKQQAKDKLEKLKKDKGKVSKDDFLAAVKDSDMTEAELKQLAKQHGINLTDAEVAKALGKKPKGYNNDDIREFLKDPDNQDKLLNKNQLEAFLKGENLGLTEDQIRDICDKNGIKLTDDQIKRLAAGQPLNLPKDQL